jgi:hypothetical protein
VTHGSAGTGVTGTSPADRPGTGGFEAILHAPSAFDCEDPGPDADVFDLQCESNSGNSVAATC